MKKDKSNKKMVIAMITKDGIAKTWIDPEWLNKPDKQSKEGENEGV